MKKCKTSKITVKLQHYIKIILGVNNQKKELMSVFQKQTFFQKITG